jgi:O-acetylhomoserine (thiol)-lyase
MPGYSDPGFDTLALHAGAAPDPATGARATPIHLSTSFVFESSEHAASCSTWNARAMSTAASATPPTRCSRSAWRRWKAAWARSPPASGQAALHLAIATLAGAGTTSSPAARCTAAAQPAALHAGALRHRTTFVQARRPGRLARRHPPRDPAAVRRNAGQPGPGRAGHPAVAAIAHDAGLPLLVDSTFTTPWLMRPFEHGADLVYHSATKFLCGHGTVVGGVLVDGGRFDWASPHASPN